MDESNPIVMDSDSNLKTSDSDPPEKHNLHDVKE